MNLYTEEQVRRAIELARDEFTNDLDTSAIIRIIYPIEIPSDEEIDDKALDYAEYTGVRYWFIDGANWMKEQITKQD